jgi:hypothetical protein
MKKQAEENGIKVAGCDVPPVQNKRSKGEKFGDVIKRQIVYGRNRSDR